MKIMVENYKNNKKSSKQRKSYIKEDFYSSDDELTFVHDVYNALADVAFKYKKKGVELTSDDWDSAYEWFADRFFIVDFDEE